MTEFKDKYFLITGASKGIGFALAERLYALGAGLILHAATDESLEKLKFRFKDSKHRFIKANFFDPESLEQVWQSQMDKNLALSGFVNCVGVRSRRPINLLKPSHVTEVLSANVTSFIEMVRLITKKGNYLPGLSMISISSISAHSGGSGVTAYAASKAATEAAVRCLAKELYKKEIRINTLVCGQVKTEAYDELMASKSDTEDKVLERQYMGLASTQNITDILLFLLSNQSRFITGSSMPADGGYLT